jgi:hypothetical protein
VRFHIEWHTARRDETFIGNMELRSLTPAQYEKVTGHRKTYEDHLRKILSDGSRAGLWKLEDTRVTTLALLAMLTGVNTWYRPEGRLSQEKLIRVYQGLAKRMVGLREG